MLGKKCVRECVGDRVCWGISVLGCVMGKEVCWGECVGEGSALGRVGVLRKECGGGE